MTFLRASRTPMAGLAPLPPPSSVLRRVALGTTTRHQLLDLLGHPSPEVPDCYLYRTADIRAISALFFGFNEEVVSSFTVYGGTPYSQSAWARAKSAVHRAFVRHEPTVERAAAGHRLRFDEGRSPPATFIRELVLGSTTRLEVLTMLGRPSRDTSLEGDDYWYHYDLLADSTEIGSLHLGFREGVLSSFGAHAGLRRSRRSVCDEVIEWDWAALNEDAAALH